MNAKILSDSMSDCTLCPRNCHADRQNGQTGFCRLTAQLRLARAALHYWEEPCISGQNGSGAIFFSGCNLQCVFCQNHTIATGSVGKNVSIEKLASIMLQLQEQGANNINLVTASHFVPQTVLALEDAKTRGLTIPVVYNTGSYEKIETLKMLDGLVDIYLPDLKYYSGELAEQFSHAEDYCPVAKKAIAEMVRQTGPASFNQKGLIQKGVIVRHMVMPGHTREAVFVLDYLKKTYGETIYISIMSQYTPIQKDSKYKELNRRVTKREYEKVVEHAISIGITNAFIQEGETAKESFIPEFNFNGLS